MTWLAPRLRERAQILVAVQVPNDDGGFDRGYRRLGTVWAELKQAGYQTVVTTPVRGVNEGDVPSHEIMVRHGSVGLINTLDGFGFIYDQEGRQIADQQGYGIMGSVERDPGGFGREYSQAFGLAYNSIVDMSPVKARWFVLIVRRRPFQCGRLFRIVGAADPTERREYLNLRVREVEEQSTGYSL